jgi:hypothetical protein
VNLRPRSSRPDGPWLRCRKVEVPEGIRPSSALRGAIWIMKPIDQIPRDTAQESPEERVVSCLSRSCWVWKDRLVQDARRRVWPRDGDRASAGGTPSPTEDPRRHHQLDARYTTSRREPVSSPAIAATPKSTAAVADLILSQTDAVALKERVKSRAKAGSSLRICRSIAASRRRSLRVIIAASGGQRDVCRGTGRSLCAGGPQGTWLRREA